MMTDKDFVQKAPCCPYCGSGDCQEYDNEWDSENHTYILYKECKKCLGSWGENYVLTGFTVLTDPSEE